jgi:hypothetical protein
MGCRPLQRFAEGLTKSLCTLATQVIQLSEFKLACAKALLVALKAPELEL